MRADDGGQASEANRSYRVAFLTGWVNQHPCHPTNPLSPPIVSCAGEAPGFQLDGALLLRLWTLLGLQGHS